MLYIGYMQNLSLGIHFIYVRTGLRGQVCRKKNRETVGGEQRLSPGDWRITNGWNSTSPETSVINKRFVQHCVEVFKISYGDQLRYKAVIGRNTRS